MRRRLRAMALTPVLLAAAACGSGDTGGSTTVTVFAAASLTSTFEDLATEFEQRHEGVDVQLSFAGSSDLVAQIQQGAPADVFASADTANMDKLVSDDLVEGEPVDFASNTLEIAVPPGNPRHVAALEDLTDADLDVVTCAPEVPCGSATREVAERAGVELSPVSEEQSVTDVLNKVVTGEADAGLVYVTDVAAAGDSVEGVALPESGSVVNTYPVAAVAGSDNVGLAKKFVDLVLSDDGQAVLEDAGFGKP